MTKALVASLACLSLALAAPRASFAQAVPPAPYAPDAQVKNPHGASLKEPCASCHSAKSWSPAVVTAAFKHSPKRFPLEGAHQSANCRACHTSLDFKGVSTKCAVCHKDVHQGELGSDCALCHSPRSFVDRSVMVQAHQTTRFPLTGAHILTDCLSCHPTVAQGHMSFVGRPVECFACHVAAYDATTNPPHKSAGFPTQCEACHTTVEWGTATFDHNNTAFPLTGAHTAVTCAQCHSSGVYKGLNTACVSCHLDKYNQTTSPAHVAAGFPQDCTICHTTATWTGATFNHLATWSDYTGAHPAVVCASCHSSGVYKGLSTLCSSCHQVTSDSTSDPKHTSAGFANTCADCHSTATFLSANWTHPTNLFQFTGAHVGLDCKACHTTGIFKGLGTTCNTCHMDKYNATTAPVHSTSGFPTTCADCHNTTSWGTATFNHLATWPDYTGAHPAVACTTCHASGVYKGLSTLCSSCHQVTMDSTNDPKHALAGFANTCNTCHNTATFTTTTWTHPTNLFQFTGAHVGLDCKACHSTGVFKGLGTTCATCHQTTYDSTSSPSHTASGFPNTCVNCHTTTTWLGAVFNHLATWPDYTGAHPAVACATCHSSGVYKGLSTLCSSCHQVTMDSTSDPKHALAGFANTCNSCHNTTAFTTTTWVHPTNLFQFTGAHVGLDCKLCHSTGVFKGLGTTCATCHQTTYDSTSNPSHKSTGFPVTCADCHTTTTWLGAVFNHLATWPDYTGAHPAQACAACHSSGVYKGLSTLCSSCHQITMDSTSDPKHSLAGFANTCNTCHNTTSFTTTTWVHPTNLFAFTGAHVGLDCKLCHTTGVFKGLGTTCITCHQTDYNNTTSPAHATAGFPTTCGDCHTTSTWLGAVFNHIATWPDYTGAHPAVACSSCHSSGVYKGLSTLCSSCHQTTMDSTTDPKHSQAGFANTCNTCHTTTNFTTSTWVHPTNLFQFTGFHIGLDCKLCHTTGVFVGLGTTCVTCHLTDYNGTNNPVHTTAGFTTDCASCHTTTSWANATFNHTYFPSNHHGSTCAQCHPTNYTTFSCRGCHGNTHNKNYTDAQCYACHPTGQGG